jgi:hypothetical protein
VVDSGRINNHAAFIWSVADLLRGDCPILGVGLTQRVDHFRGTRPLGQVTYVSVSSVKLDSG